MARLVQKYALRYNRDPNLVLAMITVESDFNPGAVSKVGAVGAMQVMPHWKKILGVEKDLTEPETSINYGLQVLAFYVERRGLYRRSADLIASTRLRTTGCPGTSIGALSTVATTTLTQGGGRTVSGP